MEKKVKITINGQSFEFPMDMSVFTGLMAPRPVSPRPIPQGIQFSHERLVQPSYHSEQSSLQRLGENFFRQIELDLEASKRLGLDEEARILTALITLHRRVKRLEDRSVVKIQEPLDTKPKKQVIKKPTAKQVKPVKNLKVQVKKKSSKKK